MSTRLSELGSIKFVSPEYMQSMPITYGLRQTTAGVRGVAPEYGIMRTETAEFGRFLNHEDVENHRRVAFLGYEVARRLFSNIPAVGETIRINGVSFEVIGVMPNKAQISNYFYPDKLSVFIPYTVNQREIRRQHPVPGDHAGAARAGDPSGARAARDAATASTRATCAR